MTGATGEPDEALTAENPHSEPHPIEIEKPLRMQRTRVTDDDAVEVILAGFPTAGFYFFPLGRGSENDGRLDMAMPAADKISFRVDGLNGAQQRHKLIFANDVELDDDDHTGDPKLLDQHTLGRDRFRRAREIG